MNLSDYADWNAAYRHFNERLFGGQLPEVVFTLQRRGATLGYASMGRFSDRDTEMKLHELAMNPDHFLARPDLDTLSTLVHEQTHIEQYCFGNPSRNGYHNAEWGTFMDRVGLTPSHTGRPGGKRTGQQMTHYIVEGGPFALAADELLAAGWRIKRGSALLQGKTVDRSKVRFSCGKCGQNAWAKAEASLVCGACDMAMMPSVVASYETDRLREAA